MEAIILLIIKWILCFFMTIYLFLIVVYYFSWRNLKVFIGGVNQSFITKVSIIIPARNEEDNIANCLDDLLQQNYPKHLMEAIIIDDNSSDKTCSIIKEFQEQNPSLNINLITLKDDQKTTAYKKRTVAEGIKEATGTLMITTDADCRYGKNWVYTIVAFYEKNHPKFISAPVCFKDEKIIFQRIQTLEFISLIEIGAAAINIRKPNMCNGANIAFEKSAYMEVNGYEITEHIASGDDMFLLLKIAAKYPDGIHFLKSVDATVYTYPKKNIKEFYQQRKRWASKGMKYNNFSVTAVALITYFANLAWLINLILVFFYPELLPLFVIQTIARMFVEIIFLFSISSFFKRKELTLLYFPTFIFNIFYVIIVGASGSIGGYTWKGRQVK